MVGEIVKSTVSGVFCLASLMFHFLTILKENEHNEEGDWQ